MLERFTFAVTGVTPILMNNPIGMKKPGESGKAQIKKIPSPEDEARGLVYRDENGKIYGPASGFKSALMGAAKGRKFGKLFATAVIKGNVFNPIDVERCYLYNPKNKKPLTDSDYTVDSRRVVMPSSGAGVVRSRPRFATWGCDVELEIETDALEAKAVLELFEIAGRTIGYLDYRPECGGSFGRFEVKLKK